MPIYMHATFLAVELADRFLGKALWVGNILLLTKNRNIV